MLKKMMITYNVKEIKKKENIHIHLYWFVCHNKLHSVLDQQVKLN